MTMHTKGPWYVTGKMTRYVEARIDGGLIQEVAACGPTEADDGYGPQQEANARLIAAAPDLLDALKDMVNLVELMCPFDGPQQRQARSAIARATGEQP